MTCACSSSPVLSRLADTNFAIAPLFEAQLDLKVPEMVFRPSLEFGERDSFFDLVESLINDVFRISSLMPRLATHSPFPHYQVGKETTLLEVIVGAERFLRLRPLQADMEEMADLTDLRHALMDRVKNVMLACCEFRDTLERYSYLYVDDRREFMRQFLLYGHVLTGQEVEDYAGDGVPESPPTLEHFKEQVDG